MRKNFDYFRILGLMLFVMVSSNLFAGDIITTNGYVVGNNTPIQSFALPSALTSDFSAKITVFVSGDSVNCGIDFGSSSSISPWGSNSRIGVRYENAGIYTKGDNTGLGGNSATGYTGAVNFVDYGDVDNQKDTLVIYYTHYFADSTYSMAYVDGDDTITIAYKMGVRKANSGEPRDPDAYNGTGFNFVNIVTNETCYDSAGFDVEILDDIFEIEQGMIKKQTEDFSFKVTMIPGENTESMFGIYSDGSSGWSVPVNVFYQPDLVLRSKVTNFVKQDYKVAQNLYTFEGFTPIDFIGTVKLSDSTFTLAVIDGEDTIYITDNETMRLKGISGLNSFAQIGTKDNYDPLFFENFEILDEVLDLTETEVLTTSSNTAYNIPIPVQKGTFGASVIVVPSRGDSIGAAVTFSDDQAVNWSGDNALNLKVTFNAGGYIKVQDNSNQEVSYIDTVKFVANKPVKFYFNIDVENDIYDIAASVDDGDITPIAVDVPFRFDADSLAYRVLYVESSDSKIGEAFQSEFEFTDVVIKDLIMPKAVTYNNVAIDQVTKSINVLDTTTVASLIAGLDVINADSIFQVQNADNSEAAASSMVASDMKVVLGNSNDTIEYSIELIAYAPAVLSTTIGAISAGNDSIVDVYDVVTVEALINALTTEYATDVEVLASSGGSAVESTSTIADGMVLSLSNEINSVEYSLGVLTAELPAITATTIGSLSGKSIIDIPDATTVSELIAALTLSLDDATATIDATGTDPVTANMVIVVSRTVEGVEITDEYTITLLVGVNHNFAKEVSVYPNPVQNTLWVKGASINKIEVYNITGKMVFTQDNITSAIDLSQLKKGIYLVRLYEGSQLINIKKVSKK